MADFIQGTIDSIKDRVKHGKLKFKKTKLKTKVMKPITDTIPDPERDKICKDARKTAHTEVANSRVRVSKQVLDDLNKGLL